MKLVDDGPGTRMNIADVATGLLKDGSGCDDWVHASNFVAKVCSQCVT